MVTERKLRERTVPVPQCHMTFQQLLMRSAFCQLQRGRVICLLCSVPQASEGVPIRFFSVLSDLVEAYYSPNMGLVTHLQFPVQKEEEVDEEPGQNTI